MKSLIKEIFYLFVYTNIVLPEDRWKMKLLRVSFVAYLLIMIGSLSLVLWFPFMGMVIFLSFVFDCIECNRGGISLLKIWFDLRDKLFDKAVNTRYGPLRSSDDRKEVFSILLSENLQLLNPKIGLKQLLDDLTNYRKETLLYFNEWEKIIFKSLLSVLMLFLIFKVFSFMQVVGFDNFFLIKGFFSVVMLFALVLIGFFLVVKYLVRMLYFRKLDHMIELLEQIVLKGY